MIIPIIASKPLHDLTHTLPLACEKNGLGWILRFNFVARVRRYLLRVPDLSRAVLQECTGVKDAMEGRIGKGVESLLGRVGQVTFIMARPPG